MLTIYRVKNYTTGEIMESMNFKKLFGIMVSELRDDIGKSGFGNYKADMRIIERVHYDCPVESEDYWNYPVVDSENVAIVHCSTLCTVYYRCSDGREVALCRV